MGDSDFMKHLFLSGSKFIISFPSSKFSRSEKILDPIKSIMDTANNDKEFLMKTFKNSSKYKKTYTTKNLSDIVDKIKQNMNILDLSIINNYIKESNYQKDEE